MKARTTVRWVSAATLVVGLVVLLAPPTLNPSELAGGHRLEGGYGLISIGVSVFLVEVIVRRSVDSEVKEQLTLQAQQRSILPLNRVEESAVDLANQAFSMIENLVTPYDSDLEQIVGEAVAKAMAVPGPPSTNVENGLDTAKYTTKTDGLFLKLTKEGVDRIASTRVRLHTTVLHANEYLEAENSQTLRTMMSHEGVAFLQAKDLGTASIGLVGLDMLLSYHVAAQRIADWAKTAATDAQKAIGSHAGTVAR